MTKAEQNMLTVIQALEANNFVEDGRTAPERVRIATTKNPVFGSIGGRPVNLGNRMRFTKTGTNIKATVGKRTTNIYTVENGNTNFLGMFDTKEITKIQELLTSL